MCKGLQHCSIQQSLVTKQKLQVGYQLIMRKIDRNNGKIQQKLLEKVYLLESNFELPDKLRIRHRTNRVFFSAYKSQGFQIQNTGCHSPLFHISVCKLEQRLSVGLSVLLRFHQELLSRLSRKLRLGCLCFEYCACRSI